MSYKCQACGQTYQHVVSGRPVLRAYVDLGGRNVTFDPWAIDDSSLGRWVLESRADAPAGAAPIPGKLVRWRLEKRGSEIVSCTDYLATSEEIGKAFGPQVVARFFAPGESHKEITLEMPLPVPEDLAAITERMALQSTEG